MIYDDGHRAVFFQVSVKNLVERQADLSHAIGTLVIQRVRADLLFSCR